MILMCGEIHIRIDVEATRQFHQRIKQNPSFTCECLNCQNYRMAIHHLSYETRSFLDSLGIDPEHPADINSFRNELQPQALDEYVVQTLLVADLLDQPHREGASYTGQHNGIRLGVYDGVTPPFAIPENLDILPPKWLGFTFEVYLPWLLDEQN